MAKRKTATCLKFPQFTSLSKTALKRTGTLTNKTRKAHIYLHPTRRMVVEVQDFLHF